MLSFFCCLLHVLFFPYFIVYSTTNAKKFARKNFFFVLLSQLFMGEGKTFFFFIFFCVFFWTVLLLHLHQGLFLYTSWAQTVKTFSYNHNEGFFFLSRTLLAGDFPSIALAPLISLWSAKCIYWTQMRTFFSQIMIACLTMMFTDVAWSVRRGDPSGWNVAGIARIWRVWRPCASGSDGSTRPSGRSAKCNPPKNTNTASHLQ